MTSLQAASEFPDAALDHGFLDADHSYKGVMADLQTWLPKVRLSGWIGGHDYKNPDPKFRFKVTRAVDESRRQQAGSLRSDANFTWFARV
ncbi:class I SAM-dependent methyltransferase [Mesorhizobium sp. M1348]